jgi:hypothetical protein
VDAAYLNPDTPFDRTRDVLLPHRVVESAYGWANGDIKRGRFVGEPKAGGSLGDHLGAYLIGECGIPDGDGAEVGSLEHWEECRRRARQCLKELTAVTRALHRYGPQTTESIDA